MPRYLVSIKKDLKDEEYEAVQQHLRDQGGKIVYTYDRGILPGFDVEFPEDAVGTMEKAPNVIGVELTEQPVKTQKD
ncbi:hypothetical protein V8E51_014748 [Hyaloscypha variabilis]|uniref:Peptidase inhibitor I9 n=1 Tax=Hyaloscypha variabilis (strain UAMH 11265 / GT02V1 / F) TaxID=1149755 RepID=A0A2J6RD12_HYAVF|nr:peptidase inhibitor I9 [Hyaloscypha variabilis F]